MTTTGRSACRYTRTRHVPRPRIVGAFRSSRGLLISSLRVPSSAKLPTGQSHAQMPCASLHDGLRPTLRRESPAEPGRIPEVAPAGLQTELNPYARDLGFHRMLVYL